MDQCQQELRQAAAQAFMESLNQLQETLQVADEPAPFEQAPIAISDSDDLFDLSSLEQAVADIEQFMQSRQDDA